MSNNIPTDHFARLMNYMDLHLESYSSPNDVLKDRMAVHLLSECVRSYGVERFQTMLATRPLLPTRPENPQAANENCANPRFYGRSFNRETGTSDFQQRTQKAFSSQLTDKKAPTAAPAA